MFYIFNRQLVASCKLRVKIEMANFFNFAFLILNFKFQIFLVSFNQNGNTGVNLKNAASKK